MLLATQKWPSRLARLQNCDSPMQRRSQNLPLVRRTNSLARSEGAFRKMETSSFHLKLFLSRSVRLLNSWTIQTPSGISVVQRKKTQLPLYFNYVKREACDHALCGVLKWYGGKKGAVESNIIKIFLSTFNVNCKSNSNWNKANIAEIISIFQLVFNR